MTTWSWKRGSRLGVWVAYSDYCTWMWLRPPSCSPVLLHMVKRLLGGAVFARANGCSTKDYLCLLPLKGKQIASKFCEVAMLLCSYHLHIDAIIFAVALWWSGNHSAASFVGEKMIRGCANAQKHCPINRYQ